MGGNPVVFLVISVFVLVSVAVAIYWRRVRSARRSREQYRTLQEVGLSIPATLHPVIDPSRCIGSGVCTRSCPQGEVVLGIVDGRATLVDPSICIGHGECAAECPTGAIRLVFGTSERGVDIPELNDRFESNVPGLYITGELGGMGLISTAVRQATEGMDNLHDELKREGRPGQGEELVDVAIIGAGPAGLTSALKAIELGLTYRLLEQAPGFGGSILQYPRHKIVMTHPVDLPLMGPAFSSRMSKEQLLDLWQRAKDRHGLRVEGGVEVQGIDRRQDGTFVVNTNRGKVRSRKVMLCVGRRGKPRKLGVPGEDSAKVAYALLEPEIYEGKRVLVVGGGDSALEAACTLAEQSGTRVTLSYRSAVFSRVRPENRQRLEQMRAAGHLKVLLESTVKEISETKVRLTAGAKEGEIANDFVLVFAGGDPPAKLLELAGVEIKRHFAEEVDGGETGQQSTQVFGRIRDQQLGRGLRDQRESGGGVSRFAIAAVLLGVVLVAAILWLGRAYYFRDVGVPVAPAAKSFSPSGFWGHGMGFFALLLFFVNFSYLARKELPAMRRAGNINTWMRVHIVSGIFAGGFALFHSTLESRNLFAASLYFSMGTVVVTGIIGRYLYGFVPRDPRGRPLAHAALIDLSKRMEAGAGSHYRGLAATLQIDHVLTAEQPGNASLVKVVGRMFIVWPARYLKLRAILRRSARELKDSAQAREFRHYAQGMFKLRLQMEYFPQIKRLMAGWRLLHAVLAVFLLALLIAHVTIDIWVGYRWIF